MDSDKGGVIGHVYIIRFVPAFHHAQFYVGWTKTGGLFTRLRAHRAGKGAKICAAAAAQGHRLELVYDCVGTRNDERAIKNLKNTPKFVRALEAKGQLYPVALKDRPKRDNLPVPLRLEDLS